MWRRPSKLAGHLLCGNKNLAVREISSRDMEIKPLTFLFEAYWEISPKMAPRNLCVGTETVYFGITEYAHFRFFLNNYRLDTVMALTRLKYHIGCVMDYAELCCWRWCSSEGDCERCRLWDSWWQTLIPKMSNTLGCRRSGKLTLLIDVRPDLPLWKHQFLSVLATKRLNKFTPY